MDALDKLLKDLKKLDGEARVGVFDPENAEKMAFAEFGTRTAPPRPVLSATFDRNEKSMERAIDNQIRTVLDGKSKTGDQILGKVGKDLQELVVEQIQGSFGKALKPSTIKGRKSRGNMDTRPLIDRSLLGPGETALVDAIEVKVGKNEDGE